MVGPSVVFLVLGIPALLESLGHIRRLDIHVLMTLGAFASAAIGHPHEGALLLLLFALSEEVEERLSLRARASLDTLSRMSPETARRLPAGASTLGAAGDGEELPAVELRTGDRILVRAGEVVPVDGEVLDGASQVGLDHLTGEPLPLAVSQGDEVMSGAVTMDGALLLRVLRPASESTIQRIGRLTATASASRPHVVTLLDAVAERWSLAVVASTAAIAVAPPLLWHAPWGPSLYRALVWLITASPCALILATPLVYVSGLSVAAANGVLLKGGRTLDALATATGVAFDKTGTITTGSPTLVRVEDLAMLGASASVAAGEAGEASRRRALLAAGALGRLSVHPVSKALAAAAPAGGAIAEVVDFQMVAGAGVSGAVALPGEAGPPLRAALGRPAFVAAHLEGYPGGVALAAAVRRAAGSDAAGSARHGAEAGGRVVTALALCPAPGMAVEGVQSAAWFFHLQDRVKASASNVLAEVSSRGPMYMLTGDCRANALNAERQLGAAARFTAVHADLRPEEKLAKVRMLDGQLKEAAASSGSPRARLFRALGVSAGGLMMVGDGVNDAPALAAATVGISLAAQAEGALLATAVEGSDVLVLRQARDPNGDEDLIRVAWILGVARRARCLVQQNIFLALASICGASALTLASNMPLWLGVLLHEGTTMLVALNSLRLFSELRGLRRRTSPGEQRRGLH